VSVEYFFELFGYLGNTYVFEKVSKDTRQSWLDQLN
ncbi:uncharacterized protein METZ01_LOCUS111056, partial [marine metagenome]